MLNYLFFWVLWQITCLGTTESAFASHKNGPFRPNRRSAFRIDDGDIPEHIASELERLQNQLSLIDAVEERNKAQLESFVDAKDQWESLEEDEQQLLGSKTDIEARLEKITSDLVSHWMGQKSMDG